MRGDRPYIRPIGSVRYGVRVGRKYVDLEWLGQKGHRTAAEWPVAYHGTPLGNIEVSFVFFESFIILSL